MKGLTFLFFGIMAALGFVLYHQNRTVIAQQKQIEALSSDLSSMKEKNSAATLDLQGKCSAQASKAFKELGYNTEGPDSYQNHYSTKRNKCYLEITNLVQGGAEITTFRNVSDAFEGKVYGSFIWRTQPEKKYWEVPPLLCKVTMPSGEEKICHSDDEFSELVKVYMEGD